MSTLFTLKFPIERDLSYLTEFSENCKTCYGKYKQIN